MKSLLILLSFFLLAFTPAHEVVIYGSHVLQVVDAVGSQVSDQPETLTHYGAWYYGHNYLIDLDAMREAGTVWIVDDRAVSYRWVMRLTYDVTDWPKYRELWRTVHNWRGIAFMTCGETTRERVVDYYE